MSHKKLKYFLPEFLIDLLRIIKKRLITFGKLGTLKSNKRFLDRYQDDSVNILANGPSLTNEVQESILGSKVIANSINTDDHSNTLPNFWIKRDFHPCHFKNLKRKKNNPCSPNNIVKGREFKKEWMVIFHDKKPFNKLFYYFLNNIH